MHPAELNLEKMERLLVHPATLSALREGRSLASIRASWAKARDDFRSRREQLLLYR
jgi:hypothetical protein